MLKLNQTVSHIVTITDSRNNNSLTLKTKLNPYDHARSVIRTIRKIHNKQCDNPNVVLKYSMFANTPAEQLLITITQHYNFQFANVITDPEVRHAVIAKHKHLKKALRLSNA